MIAARRTRWNFGLQRAIEHATALKRPLLVFEPLRSDHPYASDRLHAFVLDGMADNARDLAGTSVTYFPYVERARGDGKGLLHALAGHACCVVTDEFPGFFLPRMLAAASRRLAVRLEAVDSNGLLPLRAAPAVFPSAFAFRRFLQRELPAHLGERPSPDPLRAARLPRLERFPAGIRKRWPPVPPRVLSSGDEGHARRNDATAGRNAFLAALPIDHAIPPSPVRGGSRAGRRALGRFIRSALHRYAHERNDPDAGVTSGLSPYLHFGHVSAHEVFSGTARKEGWSAGDLGERATGRREGWWGMSVPAEAFLDQLVTWRELGYNYSASRDDADRYEGLPAWARQTLEAHASDPRRPLYGRAALDEARTADPLWNAAQRQLLREGSIHSYLRMLWGKKVLEWTDNPRTAWKILIELNDRLALDGRDPNSYSGIGWVFGRYDRPWGPRRPVFGTVRFMSSANTARKVRLKDYLTRFGEPEAAGCGAENARPRKTFRT